VIAIPSGISTPPCQIERRMRSREISSAGRVGLRGRRGWGWGWWERPAKQRAEMPRGCIVSSLWPWSLTLSNDVPRLVVSSLLPSPLRVSACPLLHPRLQNVETDTRCVHPAGLVGALLPGNERGMRETSLNTWPRYISRFNGVPCGHVCPSCNSTLACR